LNALGPSIEQKRSGRLPLIINVSLQPERELVMTEPILPLPSDHAFVLQLQEGHGRSGTCRAGRVEHLASGEAMRFTSEAELWDFVDKVLTQLTRKPKPAAEER
jgi:hypothetical protein